MNGSCLFLLTLTRCTTDAFCFLSLLSFFTHAHELVTHRCSLNTKGGRQIVFVFLIITAQGNEGQRHTTIIFIIIFIMGKGHLSSMTQKKEKSTKNTGPPQIDGPQRKHTPPNDIEQENSPPVYCSSHRSSCYLPTFVVLHR